MFFNYWITYSRPRILVLLKALLFFFFPEKTDQHSRVKTGPYLQSPRQVVYTWPHSLLTQRQSQFTLNSTSSTKSWSHELYTTQLLSFTPRKIVFHSSRTLWQQLPVLPYLSLMGIRSGSKWLFPLLPTPPPQPPWSHQGIISNRKKTHKTLLHGSLYKCLRR